jgi:hypothetical protein
VSYFLKASVDSMNGMAPALSRSHKIVVNVPEFSPPVYEQTKSLDKIMRWGFKTYGKCQYTSILQKDVLYPNEVLMLSTWIDNT